MEPKPDHKEPKVEKKQQTKQISVEVEKDEAAGIYSNLTLIAHSPSEFIIDFARMMPGLPKSKVFARIIMTPQNAKALMKTIEINVKRYEDNFGEIKLPGKPGPTSGFHTTESKN